MKLDARLLRYMTPEEFRVLTAVEMGSKNHEIVPNSMIAEIAHLRSGGSHKLLGELARRKLVSLVKNQKYDGFRLTYGGYDFLALKTFSKRDTVVSVGNQIGVGKESDIYIVADSEGVEKVLKIQRLGRVSFRTVKSNRDYLKSGKSASWMYLSRLAAAKEFAFMTVLYEHGFPVPKPFDLNRHCVVMELIDAFPLRQVEAIDDVDTVYKALMDLIMLLAEHGLIHGDFNEFNLLIKNDGTITLIDFPQMVSTSHLNAEWYFDRDVECIRTFFKKKFGYENDYAPKLSEVEKKMDLDVQVAASGFTKKDQRKLQELLEEQGDVESEGEEGKESESEENQVPIAE